ncbi:hypothetical protein QTN47_26205 [Danxiaibacter flavus]|uniref:FimB/Mfa2 family fimbrial subunit n=1 Tax=Danxiaibacter flavus TaxID=3049108 RepID=A0ABV3ZMD9_9BACT|nr:hypothetical protein QNM32_26205 [Chitinophagaceae bacterium DXS]
MSNISNVKKLLWACLCIIGVACTKTSTSPESSNNPTPPVNPSVSAKLYPVNFSLGDIEVSNSRIASKEVAARSYLRYVLYIAYDSAGHLASKVEQDSSYSQHLGAEFGIIRDSLPAGNYTIVMIGSRGKPYMGDSSESFLNKFFVQTAGDEIFYKKFNAVVGVKDTATTSVKLSRITGELQLNLTDSLPAEAQLVRMTLDNFPLYYYPGGDSVGNIVPLGWAWRYNRAENPLFNISSSIFGSNQPHTITIEGLTENYETVCEKVVRNVYVYPNKRTLLKGSINTDFSGAMTVSIDTTYSETIIQNFKKK